MRHPVGGGCQSLPDKDNVIVYLFTRCTLPQKLDALKSPLSSKLTVILAPDMLKSKTKSGSMYSTTKKVL